MKPTVKEVLVAYGIHPDVLERATEEIHRATSRVYTVQEVQDGIDRVLAVVPEGQFNAYVERMQPVLLTRLKAKFPDATGIETFHNTGDLGSFGSRIGSHAFNDQCGLFYTVMDLWKESDPTH